MACAKKCDRCGKLYEQYNSKNDRKNPNGIMILNLDAQRKYYSHGVIDLCPGCMKEFQDWMEEVKQMERLTERYVPNDEKNGISGIKVFESKNKTPLVKVLSGEYLYPAIEKLATYEDLEEQGLLVRLPCKVGEKLWCIVNSAIRELRVYRFDMPAFGTTDIVFRYADGFKLERFVGEIGKTVFLTREEAEKKLEEMKKND